MPEPPDLIIDVHVPPLPETGVICCAIVHDELYFLPAYLEHYRALGVAHFVFLDDRSTDGSGEYLAAQRDCTLLRSAYRYFDHVGGERVVSLWRNALMRRFCLGRWAILADADEFLALPPGHGLDDVIARLEAAGSRSVWGVMLDLYPATGAALLGSPSPDFAPLGCWYFDGIAHLKVRRRAKPVQVYAGARDRLLSRFGLVPATSLLQRLLLRTGLRNRGRLTLYKVPLMKWSHRHVFHGSHKVTPYPATNDLLAILHYKFTPDLRAKVAYALTSEGYAAKSREYRLLDQLLRRMGAADGPLTDEGSVLLDRLSRPYDAPAARGAW